MCWGSYTYGYDAIGNLKTRTGSKALTYTYDTSNRLSTVTGAAARTYGYDARARVTSDGRFTFNWNQADQITGPRGVATYSYDGNGKRAKIEVSASTTEFAFYDLAGKLRATIKGSTTVDYLDLDGKPFVERSSSGAVTYLHPDWLGSPRLATKADGTMLWREHFDPYGKKLNGVVEKRGFTGHAYDAETGMTYMLARYYDAEVGRFLMTDPIGSKDDLNLYAYVHGDPVNGTDPTGLERDEKSEITTGSRLPGGASTSMVSVSPGAMASVGPGNSGPRNRSAAPENYVEKSSGNSAPIPTPDNPLEIPKIGVGPDSARGATSSCCGSALRAPDFVQFSFDLYVFNFTGTFSRSGRAFFGGGFGRTYPSPKFTGTGGSIAVGWLNKLSPSTTEIDNFVGGLGYSKTAFYNGVGGGVAWSPGSGTATLIGVGEGFSLSPGGIQNNQGNTGLGGW